MPRGDKSKYSDKQQRQARHIEEGYETRGVSEDESKLALDVQPSQQVVPA